MQQLRTVARRTHRARACLLRLGAVLFAGLAIFGTACERATRQKTSPLLTTTSEVRRVSLADVKRGYPVRLHGIATYYHAPSASLVLQTGTDGILIDVSQIKTPIEAGRDIEIVGVTGVRESSAIVIGTTLKDLRPAQFPAATRVS